MSGATIELCGVRFAWPGGFTLRIEDWQLPAGASALLYGPSGSGKSTLLRLLSGEERPHAGQIRLWGTDLGGLSESQRRAFRIQHIGLVFQDSPLLEALSVEENVLLPFRLNPALRLLPSVRQKARDLLAELGLGGRERDRPVHLSGGERQRVGIARALITDPRLVLADEATAGLDPTQARAVVDRLQGKDRSVLLVSHDPQFLPIFPHLLRLDGAAKA